MSKMLTSVARMLRTGGMRGYTPRAKTILKREANRSERHAPIPFAEYGSEEDDILIEKLLSEQTEGYEPCAFCATRHDPTKMVWVKRFESGPCDCCTHYEWVGFCSECCILPRS